MTHGIGDVLVARVAVEPRPSVLVRPGDPGRERLPPPGALRARQVLEQPHDLFHGERFRDGSRVQAHDHGPVLRRHRQHQVGVPSAPERARQAACDEASIPCSDATTIASRVAGVPSRAIVPTDDMRPEPLGQHPAQDAFGEGGPAQVARAHDEDRCHRTRIVAAGRGSGGGPSVRQAAWPTRATWTKSRTPSSPKRVRRISWWSRSRAPRSSGTTATTTYRPELGIPTSWTGPNPGAATK
jgi:hypothetical protein